MTEAEGQYLVEAGVIKQEELDAALKQAGGGAQDLEAAILALGVVDPPALGRALAQHHALPYLPLGSADIMLARGQALSQVCCEHWGVVPVAFDSSGSILTVAVASPERARSMQRVSELLMRPYDLAFTIASQTEITALLKQRADNVRPSAMATSRVATGEGAARPRTKPSALSPSTGKRSLHIPTRVPVAPPEPEAPKGPEPSGDLDPAHDLARPLINAVAMLVGARLTDAPARHDAIRARARYCQLLASRLHASALDLTMAVIAAWASSIEDRSDLLRQLMLPFDVEEVITPPIHADVGLAARVLSLVQSYEAFAREPGGDTPDVNLVRRHLMVAWSGARAHQDTLEAFLQVLMDEQYLRTFDVTTSGSLLIVDPQSSLTAEVKQPLATAGCRVDSVASARDARDAISTAVPDLMIVDARSSAKEILELCQVVHDGHPGVKIIVITGPASDVRGAMFLRAGVADLLTSPLDLEVLCLTVEKNLAVRSEQESATGVQKGISGSLTDMSFNDMIQILSAGAKNLRIAVTNDDRHAQLFMRAGDIIHCELDDKRGPEAFYALMRWTQGTFAANQCRDFPEPTISVSTMSLLMEGSRQLDEEVAQ
jgi:DNA-binding response OmpR family regulator